MGTTNEHAGADVKRDLRVADGQQAGGAEGPPLRASIKRARNPLGVLSCLLLLAAGEAPLVQWVAPQRAAAGERNTREVTVSEGAVSSAPRQAPLSATPRRVRELGQAPLAVSVPPLADQGAPRAPRAVHSGASAAPAAAQEGAAQEGGATLPSDEAPTQVARKVRDGDELVRDGNQLLLQHPAMAKQLFQLAVAVDGRNPHAHAGHAKALLLLNKPLEARVAVESAIRIRPRRASYQRLRLAVLKMQLSTEASSTVGGR